MLMGGASDGQQLLRHLLDCRGAVPQWRQPRPALMAEAAAFYPAAADPSGAMRGNLAVR
jgi:hypothetical protein